MNIFLPYENNIEKSVESLDDKRLNKQILECKTLLTINEKEMQGITVKGYAHHPVYTFYKNNPEFIAYYGYRCCVEYMIRFDKYHESSLYFDLYLLNHDMFNYYNNMPISIKSPNYTPYYMEGSLGQPNYVRTTENVSKLFQNKLINKWNSDKDKHRHPKWTNRTIPDFYSQSC